jgi:hypothetical protein
MEKQFRHMEKVTLPKITLFLLLIELKIRLRWLLCYYPNGVFIKR